MRLRLWTAEWTTQDWNTTAIKTALEHQDPTARASVFLTITVDPKRPLSSQRLTWFNCYLTKFKCDGNFHILLFRWIRMTMIQFCSYSTWWRNSLRKLLQLLTRYETNSLLPQVSYHPCVDMTFVLDDLNVLLLDLTAWNFRRMSWNSDAILRRFWGPRHLLQIWKTRTYGIVVEISVFLVNLPWQTSLVFFPVSGYSVIGLPVSVRA